MATYEVDTDIIQSRIDDATKVLNDVLNSSQMFTDVSTNFSPEMMKNWLNNTYKFSELATDASDLGKKIQEYVEWMQTTLQEIIDGDIGRGKKYDEGGLGDAPGGAGGSGSSGGSGGTSGIGSPGGSGGTSGLGSSGGGTSGIRSPGGGTTGLPGSGGGYSYSAYQPLYGVPTLSSTASGSGYSYSYSNTASQLLYGPAPGSTATKVNPSYTYSSTIYSYSYSNTAPQLLYGPAPGTTSTYSGPIYSYSYSITPSQLLYGPAPGSTATKVNPSYSYNNPSYSFNLPSYSSSNPYYNNPSYSSLDPYNRYNPSSTSSLYDPTKSYGPNGPNSSSSLLNGPYGPYDPNNLYDPNNPNSPYYKGLTGNDKSGKTSSANSANSAGNSKNGLSNVKDALSRTGGKLAKGLSPSSSGFGAGSALSPLSMAGLGLAAGGAIAGAGILLSRNKKYIFKPEDWDALDEDTQNSILYAMDSVGFEKDDIEAFANATFEVPRSEIDPHVDNIKDALEIDINLPKEIYDIYGFSCIDQKDDIVKYLLFIILSLDGVKFDDNYNIYNVLNEYLEEDKIDFTYSGINMFEYMKNEDLVEQDEESEYENIELDEAEA